MAPRDQTLRPSRCSFAHSGHPIVVSAAPPKMAAVHHSLASKNFLDASSQVVMGRPTPNRITSRQKTQTSLFKLDRLPDYLKDTVDWIIGKMSVATARQVSIARRSSVDDMDAPGCCPAKILISSIMGLARKRRDDKITKTKRGVVSASIAQRTLRKSQSSELCVCDSIDDQMVEKFTRLPSGIDRKEWLAANSLSLFDQVNSLCGSLSEICSPATCQSMSFPGTSKAQFVDEKGKRHNYSAQQYVHAVLSYCETESRNENIFPTKYGNQFSVEFESRIKRVIRLLWHCLGHLYLKHWDHLGTLELRSQCAMVLAHLSCLSKMFNILDPKDQQVVEETVSFVRPPLFTVQAPSEEKEEAPDGLRYSRVPSSKSGSWGGHPTPAVLSCKPYAQTC